MAKTPSALPDLSVYDSGPKLLLWNVEIRGARSAMREKYLVHSPVFYCYH
jgi:hypothetical protein